MEQQHHQRENDQDQVVSSRTRSRHPNVDTTHGSTQDQNIVEERMRVVNIDDHEKKGPRQQVEGVRHALEQFEPVAQPQTQSDSEIERTDKKKHKQQSQQDHKPQQQSPFQEQCHDDSMKQVHELRELLRMQNKHYLELSESLQQLEEETTEQFRRILSSVHQIRVDMKIILRAALNLTPMGSMDEEGGEGKALREHNNVQPEYTQAQIDEILRVHDSADIEGNGSGQDDEQNHPKAMEEKNDCEHKEIGIVVDQDDADNSGDVENEFNHSRNNKHRDRSSRDNEDKIYRLGDVNDDCESPEQKRRRDGSSRNRQRGKSWSRKDNQNSGSSGHDQEYDRSSDHGQPEEGRLIEYEHVTTSSSKEEHNYRYSKNEEHDNGTSNQESYKNERPGHGRESLDDEVHNGGSSVELSTEREHEVDSSEHEQLAEGGLGNAERGVADSEAGAATGSYQRRGNQRHQNQSDEELGHGHSDTGIATDSDQRRGNERRYNQSEEEREDSHSRAGTATESDQRGSNGWNHNRNEEDDEGATTETESMED